MPGFQTDADLQTQLEGVIKVAAGTLVSTTPSWGPVITQANATAFARISEVFLEKGYTAAQVLSWDNGVVYQQAIGLYLCLTFGAGLHGYDDKFIEKYKWFFDKIADRILIANGAPQAPGSVASDSTSTAGGAQTSPGLVDHGPLHTHNQSFHLDVKQNRMGLPTGAGTRW